MPRQKREQILYFPSKGVNVVVPRSTQVPDTCVNCLNVRAFDTLEDRARGGIRPGLTKFNASQINGTRRIQDLAIATTVRDADPSNDAVYVRDVYGVATSGGKIVRFTSSATTDATTGGSRTLSAYAPFVFSTQLFNKLYYTDGISYKIWHGANNTTSDWTLNTGSLPGTDGTKTARLIEAWRGRIVLAGLRDSPHNFWMTKLGDPLDLNTAPAVTTEIDAVVGSPGGTLGPCEDVINSIIPYSDDLLLLGCDSSIWAMTGDPMSGGRLDQITGTIGTAFGRPWCRDDAGNIYFMSNRGDIWRYAGGQITNLTEDTIGPLIQNTNLNSTVVRMGYDPENSGFHVFLTPITTAGVDNNAITLDGSTAYCIAKVGAISNTDQGAISGWFKTTTNTLSTVFCYMEDKLSGNYFDINVLANGLMRCRLLQTGGGASWSFYGNTTINDGAWHHYLVQSNGSAHELWIDGTQENKSYLAGTNNGDWLNELTSIERVMIGAWEPGTVAQFFDGTVDETFITNTYLNSTLVGQVYNSGAGVVYADLPAAVSNVVTNYWPLNPNQAADQTATLLESASSEYLDGGDEADFDPGSGDFSIEGWFYLNGALAADQFYLAAKRGDANFGSQSGWILGYQGATTKWGVIVVENTDGSYTRINTGQGYGANLISDEWHHIALTYDNSSATLKIYFDGSDSGWGTSTSGAPAGKTVTASGKKFTLGCSWNSGADIDRFVNGRMAQWNFYKGKVLSTGEIETIYNLGQGLKETSASRPAGRTHGWSLDQEATPYTDVVGSLNLTAASTPSSAETIPIGIGGIGDDVVGDCGFSLGDAANTTNTAGITGGVASPTSANTFNWFYDTRTGGWFQDKFASNTYNPTCAVIFDGDDPDDRRLVIGSDDGYLRYFDRTAATDDSTTFEASVTLGPILTPGEHILTSVQAITDANGASTKFEILRGDTAELALIDASATFTGEDGTFTPGLSLVTYPRDRAYATYLKVGTNNSNTRWGLEYIKAGIADIPTHRGRHHRTK